MIWRRLRNGKNNSDGNSLQKTWKESSFKLYFIYSSVHRILVLFAWFLRFFLYSAQKGIKNKKLFSNRCRNIEKNANELIDNGF
jgi:hypothetical protein